MSYVLVQDVVALGEKVEGYQKNAHFVGLCINLESDYEGV